MISDLLFIASRLNTKYTGWKIAYEDENGKLRSLQGGGLLPISGSKISHPQGLFVGYPRRFVEDYYAGNSDEREVLLEVEFYSDDILGNYDPDNNREGEVKIKQNKVKFLIRFI